MTKRNHFILLAIFVPFWAFNVAVLTWTYARYYDFLQATISVRDQFLINAIGTFVPLALIYVAIAAVITAVRRRSRTAAAHPRSQFPPPPSATQSTTEEPPTSR